MQPTTSQEAFNQLQTFQTGRKKSADVLNEAKVRAGVPSATQRKVGLRSAIMNTENLLRAVDPSVSGRTQGNFVTDAQRNRLVQLERQPLSEQFREQDQALQGETANEAALMQQALQEAQLSLADEDKKESSLKTAYDILLQREQEAEARRLAEQQAAEARRAAAAQSSYLSGLFGGGGANTQVPQTPRAAAGSAPVARNSVEQDALNEVYKRFESQKPADIIGDYVSTYRGFKAGNQRDKLKLQYYSKKFAEALPGWLQNKDTAFQIAQKVAKESPEAQKFLQSNLLGIGALKSIPLSFISSNKVTF